MSLAGADAGKAGVGKEAASASKMSLEEAHKILGTSQNAPLEEILKANSSPFTFTVSSRFVGQVTVPQSAVFWPLGQNDSRLNV